MIRGSKNWSPYFMGMCVHATSIADTPYCEFTQKVKILINPLRSGWIVLKVKYDSLAVHSHSGCNEPGDTENK